MAHDIFISYASADRAAAQQVCDAIERDGLRCWIAPRDIAPGADWSVAIVDAIKRSAALVLVMSGQANQSAQIPREIERAVAARIPVVPFRIENVLPAGPLEFSLATVHWFDAISGPLAPHLRALIEHVRSIVDASPEARAAYQARRETLAKETRARRSAAIQRAAIAAPLIAAAVTLLTSFAWNAGPLAVADARILDWRFTLGPTGVPSDRLLLVSIDEASLIADPTPLTARADEIGRTIARMYDAGAKAVAIDLLLPETFGRSQPFADLVVRHHDTLTLAALANTDGSTIGPEALSGLISSVLGPPAAGRLFGLVNLPLDADGSVRRVPRAFADSSGALRPSWSARAATTIGKSPTAADPDAPMPIDYRADAARLRRVSWKDAAMFLDTRDPIFRDRLVLVGAEYSGTNDIHAVPSPIGRRDDASGLEVQALAVNTILEGMPLRESGRIPALAATTVVAALCAFVCLISRRMSMSIVAIAAAIAVVVAVGATAFVSSGLVAPTAGPVLAVLAAAIAALVLRPRILAR